MKKLSILLPPLNTPIERTGIGYSYSDVSPLYQISDFAIKVLLSILEDKDMKLFSATKKSKQEMIEIGRDKLKNPRLLETGDNNLSIFDYFKSINALEHYYPIVENRIVMFRNEIIKDIAYVTHEDTSFEE